MRIGLDFDNTIVTYDTLFHRIATEQALVPPGIAVSKVAVRDHLRALGNEAAFTAMQGDVYGARMAEAQAFSGVIDFIRDAQRHGADVVIVSHKTRYPFAGPAHDLHAAAGGWIDAMLRHDGAPLLAAQSVFFEPTKQHKIARIAACACDYFIDDLPEILRMSGYPDQTVRMLFDPEGNHASEPALLRFDSWPAIHAFFEQQWNSHN